MERMNNIDKYGYSSLLTEISIQDKYQKETQLGKNKLPFDLFQQLCELDPTTKPNKVGKYSNWILAKYNPNTDLNTLRVSLEWYADGIKQGILNRLGINNDINSFKSYDELINTMTNINQSNDSQMSNSEYNNRQKFEGQFEILGNTHSYDIVQPLTFKAERYFGSGTKWCTVANESYFNRYTNNGPLYILYPKNGDKELKMQFHFESKSFADYEDIIYPDPRECLEHVIEDENEMNDLLQLCKIIWPNERKEMFMSFKERLMDVQQRLANGEDPKNVFDEVSVYNDGFAIVRLKNEFNFITREGRILSENQWFSSAGYFYKGFATVSIKGKGWNFITREGRILSENQWFNNVSDFREGFAKVFIKGKGWNLINTEGRIISENQWFDDIYGFTEGFAPVKIQGKGWNFINREGRIISKNLWFEEVESFNNGFAQVYRRDMGYNYINTEGQIVGKT